ncbi:MAG: hypothetical protein IKC49_02050 [Clostridia bacterium]|nr:hypothetical protein [Clostridia bacterium]
MAKKPDRELRKIMRDYARNHIKLVTDTCIQEVCINITKELFTLINQLWASDPTRFNEGLIKQKALFNLIKKEMTKEGQNFPFNNKELYKRIRESIVHNSEINPNFVFDLTSFQLNLGKVNGSDYIVKLNGRELIELIEILSSNVLRHTQHGKMHITPIRQIEYRSDIRDNMKLYNDDNTLVDLDYNQIERAYNYFYYVKENRKQFESDADLDVAIRFPDCANENFNEKVDTLKILMTIGSNTTWDQIVDKFPKLKTKLDSINFYFSLISNLLFTLASSQSNEELFNTLNGCIRGLTKENVRHFRNALCHGRYFHDFDKTYYFYDGKKEFTYQFKLTINDINKILDKVANGSFVVATMKQEK